MAEQIISASGTQHGLIVNADGTLTMQSFDRPLTQKMAYSGNNVQYVGEAEPGANTGSAVWRIRKLTYNASNLVTDVQWAAGSVNFTLIWDSRATYTYK